MSFSRLFAFALGLSLIASACAPAAAPGPSSASGGGTAATPRRGGTFVGVITGDPQAGNRDTNTDLNTFYAFGPVFSSLVRVDATRQPSPELAESWTVSPDGKTYTFKIHANAKFHDGTPVTSEDVRFTAMDVAAKYQAAAIPILRNVDHVDTPDATTVVFVLKQPSAVFLLALAAQFMAILPKKLYDGTDPRTNPHNNTPVGSGPFKFKEWVKGDHITLVRNDSYYIPGEPYLDQVIYRVIPDAGSRTIAFQKGDIDFLPGQFVAREQAKDLGAVPGVQIDDHSGPPGQELLFFNTTKKPLDDVRVRTAICSALDQKAFVERAFFGSGAKVATSHVETDLGAFHDPNVKLPAFDVAAANKLLDEAGYPKGADGTRFKLRIMYSPGNDSDRRSAELVRDQLTAVGITVSATPLDQAVVAKQVFTDADFEMFNASVTSNNDPELGKSRHYVSSTIGAAYGNGSRYKNATIDQLFAQGASTANVDQRRDAYWKAQEILAKDLPTFPLVDYANIDFARPEVQGFGSTPLGFPYHRMDNVWRTK